MSMPINKKNRVPALVLGEIGLIRGLGEAGITVYAGTEYTDNPALYSRYVKGRLFFSSYTSDQFIDELCHFGEAMGGKTVIYSDDDNAILNIARNQEKLTPYFLFLFPDADLVPKILDKQTFCDLIEHYDLPAPRSVQISSVDDLIQKNVAALNFPCVIKPAFKQHWWGGEFEEKIGAYQKALKCDSYDDLLKTYAGICELRPEAVVQEFIPGDEGHTYSVNMYVRKNGKLGGYFIARKLRTYPLSAGEGAYIVTVKDDQMLEMAVTIADKMNLRGLLNIQFKRNSKTGKPVLLEIHTRISVWNYLGTSAGMNLAELYYRDLAEGGMDTRLDYKENVAFIFLEKDAKAFIQNIKKRKVAFREWTGTYFKRFVPGGYKINDPLPGLMGFWYFLKRKLLASKSP